MSDHRMFVPTVVVEDLLQLPEGTHIRGATVNKGEMVLVISSQEELGADEVNALYGNVEEDSTQLVFGMFEARQN